MYRRSYYFHDAAEERQKKVVRRCLGRDQNVTPWQFVLSLREDVIEFLMESRTFPSWAKGEHFGLGVRRGVDTWDATESVSWSKDGDIVDRDYIKAEFEVVLKWRGRNMGISLDLTWEPGWQEDSDFHALLYYDMEKVREMFVKISRGEDIGKMVVEEDL